MMGLIQEGFTHIDVAYVRCELKLKHSEGVLVSVGAGAETHSVLAGVLGTEVLVNPRYEYTAKQGGAKLHCDRVISKDDYINMRPPAASLPNTPRVGCWTQSM